MNLEIEVAADVLDMRRDDGRRFVERAWKWHRFNPSWMPGHFSAALRMAALTRFHRQVLVELDTGQQFLAYPDDMIQCTICVNREWEGLIHQSVRSLIPAGGTVLDVGAHVGYSSTLFADWVGEDGRVHAFEPLPWHREQIAENARVNGFEERVQMHPFAISDRAGKASFFYSNSLNTGMGSLYTKRRSSRQIDVETCRLDDWRHANGVEKADLVKIDVEGAELDVLAGMEEGNGDGAYPVLLIEVHGDALTEMGRSVDELVETIESQNYALFAWSAEHRFEPYSPELPRDYFLAKARS